METPLDFGSYSPDSESGKALDSEVTVLLDKGVVEETPGTPGFYSQLLVVPKNSWWCLRSIGGV